MKAGTMLEGISFLISFSSGVTKKIKRKCTETYAANLVKDESVGIVPGLQSRPQCAVKRVLYLLCIFSLNDCIFLF